MAVDGSGDVFIADTCNNRVVVDKPNGSGGYTQSVVDDTGLYYPRGVAVDGSGDVFIADTGNNRVVVDKPNGSGGYTQSVVDAPACPSRMGWRSTGPGTCSSPTPTTTGWWSTSPTARAATPRAWSTPACPPRGGGGRWAGDVFIADTGNNRVVEHSTTAPTARFTSAQTAGSLSVAFTDASTAASPATITGGRGTSGTAARSRPQQNPSHPYGSTGTYTVSLTVTDSNGQTSTVTQQVVVAAVHASLTYPTAGQTDVNTATPFQLGRHSGGQGYQLWIGTSRGDGSLLKSGPLSATTSTYQVPALPTGVTLWARLYTEVGGRLGQLAGLPFTVTANRVVFTYPTAGQQNINTLTPFAWSPVTGAQAYRLTIGNHSRARSLW